MKRRSPLPAARAVLQDAGVMATLTVRGGLWRDLSARGAVRMVRQLALGRRDFYMAIGLHAASRPDEVALVDSRGSLTWAELHGRIRSVTTWLEAQRIGRGDRVGVVVGNRSAFFVTMAAVSTLGAVPVPLSPQSPVPELVRRLRDAGAVACFCLAKTAEGLSPAVRLVVSLEGARWREALATRPRRRLRLPAPADEPELLLYTSGTTGRSKGTRMNTRGARLGTPFRYLDAFEIGRDTVFVTPCPLYHAAPFLLSGLTLLAGGRVIVQERLGEPDAAAAAWRRHGVTHAFLVPTLMERLLAAGPEVHRTLRDGSLRVLLNGGAPLRAASKTALLAALGEVLYDFYGATELGVVSVASPQDLAANPRSVGRVLTGVEVQLRDEQGACVAPGQAGELFVRSDVLADGYEGLAEEASSWSSVGDVARRVDGRLELLERKRDLILSGGVNLFPADIEEAVESHPDVQACAVVGVEDERWGEAVHAFVVAVPGACVDLDELRATCAALLHPAAVPKGFHLVPQLPRTETGKLLRRRLVAQLTSNGPPPG